MLAGKHHRTFAKPGGGPAAGLAVTGAGTGGGTGATAASAGFVARVAGAANATAELDDAVVADGFGVDAVEIGFAGRTAVAAAAGGGGGGGMTTGCGSSTRMPRCRRASSYEWNNKDNR
jgi:hypothetical protein